MFRICKTKHNFSQNEAYTKHKIQKCNSLNARLSFSCQSIRFLVKEVSVSSAYFCYKFVVCLIFLHFFQKIWLLMNLYIPLQRGSDILKTTESSLRRCRTSADRNVGCCIFMQFPIYYEEHHILCIPVSDRSPKCLESKF